MRLTERQLRLAVREAILREGFLDKLFDFLSGDPKKREQASGVGKSEGPSGFRYPAVVEYLQDDADEPKVKELGGDATPEEWEDWWEKNKNEPLRKNARYVKNLVKELDLESQVMFFKDISDDLKNALIAKSNIFVMPSIIHKSSVEGFGIVYAEAGQYGVPSIGGKDGGAPDAIDHEKTGLICDGNDLDDIYSSINSMLENKKYLEFGKNAKEFVTKFYWSNIIEEFKKILS